MMQEDWIGLLQQEGTVGEVRIGPTADGADPDGDGDDDGDGDGAEMSESDDLPCPACGTAAPLEDGACTDCGLQLE